MAGFDLNAYETVDERIARFYRSHESGRIETDLLDTTGEIGKSRWVVKARVFRSADDEKPAGEGMAFEVDGAGMANKTAALENAETSAVGRALAQAGFSGNKRTTREEMAKAAVGELKERAGKAEDKATLQALWKEAQQNGVLPAVQDVITARVEALDGAS